MLLMDQVMRQGIIYSADSFVTIVEKAAFVRLIPDSDVIVGE